MDNIFMKNWFLNLNKWMRWIILFSFLAIALYLIKIFAFPSKIESPYITAKPVVMDLKNVVMATGITNAYQQVSVGAQVSGQIEELRVAVGQKVKKGDVLAVISQKQNWILTGNHK
jgi:macrolide-specific efflux system membrane fusion protein